MKYLSGGFLLIFLSSFFIFFINIDIQAKASKKDTITLQNIQEKKPTNKPTVKQISVKDKKTKFRKLIVPAVKLVYDELDLQYKETLKLLENNKSTQKIIELKESYEVESDEELLMALKPHPKSIAIAQAAMESAWATSRFFKEANNLFGVWASSKSASKIAALKQRGTKTIWLKKYSCVEDSIRDYYKTLSRSKAYKEFRELKMKTDNPYELVKKLDKYSEIGAKYGEELSKMIKYNKFFLYDEKQYKPEVIKISKVDTTADLNISN